MRALVAGSHFNRREGLLLALLAFTLFLVFLASLVEVDYFVVFLCMVRYQ